jgi:site-specific DNA recombinase
VRYFLYARKSSEEKTRQVQSIEDQIEALRPAMEQRGLQVVDVLTESRSAKAPGRPVFNEMVGRIQRGQADGILCWHLNRLTRNEIDSGTIRWMLRNGIIREIVTPHRVYRPEDNALVTALESAMGEQFIVELTQNTRRGVLSKVEKGWFPGKVPQGYKNDIIEHTIARDTERWEAIRRAWDAMLTGTTTVPQIAIKLSSEWGYQTPRGGSGMPRTTLYRIFTNPFYTGFFEWEGELHPGKHEPMITPQEFERVQELLGKGTPKKRVRTHEFAFSGLIRCGNCGRMVCADKKKKIIKDTKEERLHTYYACGRGSACKVSGRLKESEIETQIAEALQGIQLPPAFLEFTRDVVGRWRDEQHHAEQAMRQSQNRALADVESQIAELLTLRLKRFVDDVEFEKRQATLKAERSSVLMQSAKVTQAMEQSWDTVERVAEFCVEAPERFRIGSLTERAAISRALGVSYTLRLGKLVIEENELTGLVRAFNKNAATISDSLEPLEIGSGSSKTDGSTLFWKGWGDLLDVIRTKTEHKSTVFYFPTLGKRL